MKIFRTLLSMVLVLVGVSITGGSMPPVITIKPTSSYKTVVVGNIIVDGELHYLKQRTKVSYYLSLRH